MEIFFYLIIFIIGTLFGSFYTLAVYRIPKRQDIVHTHSYCPNCNHKLGLLDLFPIFSYILLGGKCRYCKQKIRPRYLILYIAILIFDTITLKKKAQSTYTSGILLSVITMVIFTSEYITGLSIVVALLAITIYVLIHKIKNITNKNKKTDKQITDNISFGFYIGFSNVLLFIMALLYNNYIL